MTIPNSVTNIGYKAFYGCPLTDIYCDAEKAPKCGANVFTIEKAYCNLWVLPNSYAIYKASSDWTDFNIQALSKDAQDYTITVSPAGYATFYSSESAYELPNGLSAQVVTNCSNNKLTYKTIADGSVSGVIPAATAVVLVSDTKKEGKFMLTPSSSTAKYSGTNYLHGSDEATNTSASGSNYFYKLTYGDGANSNVFGWYWGANNGDAFLIDAHKAWLALPKSAVTRSTFSVDEATAIEDIESAEGDNIYYDLQGRRIEKPSTTGIYIVNGKKVIIKK